MMIIKAGTIEKNIHAICLASWLALIVSRNFCKGEFCIVPRCFGAAKIANFMIFGRTDLRTGVSEAKFDARADFEVRFAVAPRKRHEKQIFRSKHFEKKNWRQIFF